jgi:hypothetical protein
MLQQAGRRGSREQSRFTVQPTTPLTAPQRRTHCLIDGQDDAWRIGADAAVAGGKAGRTEANDALLR